MKKLYCFFFFETNFYETFLLHKPKFKFRHPFRIGFSLDEIEVDSYVSQILAESAKTPEVTEVIVNMSNGCWERVETALSMIAQQRASTPRLGNSGSVPQCPMDMVANRPLKRDADCVQSNFPGIKSSFRC